MVESRVGARSHSDDFVEQPDGPQMCFRKVPIRGYIILRHIVVKPVSVSWHENYLLNKTQIQPPIRQGQERCGGMEVWRCGGRKSLFRYFHTSILPHLHTSPGLGG